MKALGWVDTRDMHADGLTKGVVDRIALHQIMNGIVAMEHECKIFTPTGKASLRGIAASDE